MSTLTHPQIHDNLLAQDLARLEYGRLLWRSQKSRERLLNHWNDGRHPYRDRFQTHRAQIERILNASGEQDDALNQTLLAEGTSLRALVREIPPVFGSFYGTSSEATP
jgi:hypothetical protein